MEIFIATTRTRRDRDLPPVVVEGVSSAGRGGELVIGVRLPGDGAIVLPDVLVLDSGIGRDVHSDCIAKIGEPFPILFYN